MTKVHVFKTLNKKCYRFGKKVHYSQENNGINKACKLNPIKSPTTMLDSQATEVRLLSHKPSVH